VASAAKLAGVGLVLDRRPRRQRPGRLANRVGESLEVIDAGYGTLSVDIQPEDLPTTWRGQAVSVALAQVVGVWLGVGRQRANHRG
jgi:hypothetical protein